MATTLQELQDKRKELQITNPNATMLDAKSALSPSPITNAPVAWVAPAITNPTPVAPTAPVSVHDNPTYQSNTTEQYNQWVMAQNKAKAAARADTSQANPPAIIQQAQNKPLNAEEQAINNQFWWNIQSNGINDRQPLNQAITDAKTWNITAFDKIPWNIENKWSVIPPPVTIGDMYNNLVNKIDVTPEQKALPTFKIAQNRFNKANMFSSMTPAELSTEMKSAKLVEWSPAWEDLKVMNPELVRSTKALNTANGIKPEIFTYINNPDGTKVKQNNLEQSFVSDYNDNYSDIVKILTDIYKPDTAAEARAKIYTPEVRQAEEKATAIELEMNKISDTISWIEKDLEKEYAWTWATGSRIALEKQYRNEQLTNQYNSLLKNYTTYANKANNLITQNTDLYKSEQEGKKALSTALAWVALKDYGMQAEADFARKEAIKNINDPATAINNVIEEYKKLGIPFTSTLQSRLQEFANSGKSLPDYLTEMTQNIQASPWYKDYEAKKAWEWTSYVQFGDKVYKNVNWVLTETSINPTKATEPKTPKWAQDMNGNWYNENSATSPAEQIGSGAVDIWTGTLLDVLGKNVWTYTWNRGYDLAWNLWDPLPAWGNWKVIATDTAWEQVGSIFKGGKWAKPYGNTVVMEDENGNQIRYSHLQDIWVQKWDTLGFWTVIWTRGNTGNVLWANWEKLTAEQLAQGRGAHVDIEIKDKNGRLLSNEEQKNYLAWIKKPEATQNLSIYRAYSEDGKLPSKDALKWMWMTSQQFINNADAGYGEFLNNKSKELSSTYPTIDISYTPTYAQNSPTQREKLNDSVAKISDIDDRLTQLKKLFEKNWTEVWPTEAKKKMASLRQQIILKAKDVENLWVLNWPDLWILESLIPETTWLMSWLFSIDKNTLATLGSVQENYRSDAKTKAINYWAKLLFADAIEKELADSF